MPLTAIDAFAGAGGLSLGLRRAGFRVALAFDNDAVAVETYRKNLTDNVEELDASTTTGAVLLERAGLGSGELDLLAGGPPCQGFSIQRRGERQDDRNRLVLRYLDWIRTIRPRAFLIENVPAIKGVRGGYVLHAITEAAKHLAFTVHIATLNAADYGLAQNRRRVFLIAVDKDINFSWPRRSTERLTVRQAIGDLPSPPPDGRPHPWVPNHYREARLSQRNIDRIRHVPEGGGREHLPPHLRLACHSQGHRHLDTYGRLAWDEPSVTITARFDSFTRGRFGHPVEDRSLTLREGARLQGFPDDFVFLGNREQGARLVGNAVPPPLAAEIGRALALALT